MKSEFGAMYATGMGTIEPRRKANNNACSTDYHALKEGLEKTQRFLQYDGQVMRFLAVEVYSIHPPYFPKVEEEIRQRGEDVYSLSNGHGFVVSANAKRYALSFYLASLDTEVVVQRGMGHTGAGDEPMMIMKKSRLAKNWREAQRFRVPPSYYNVEDFHCGEIVDCYGRLFLLVGCDEKTHEAYRSTYGIFQNEVPLIAENEVNVVQPIPSQGDGFLAIGSAQDTLATVYGMPKVTKDYKKIARLVCLNHIHCMYNIDHFYLLEIKDNYYVQKRLWSPIILLI